MAEWSKAAVLKTATEVPCDAEIGEKRGHEVPRGSERARRGALVGRADGAPTDPEIAIVDALSRAAEAGRFDVVAQLAKELEARRLAGVPNAVDSQARQRQSK